MAHSARDRAVEGLEALARMAGFDPDEARRLADEIVDSIVEAAQEPVSP